MENQKLFEKALALTENGQNSSADVLYDQLLESEPNNAKFIFYKGFNMVDSAPNEAINFFTKVLATNPTAYEVYNNIFACAMRSKEYDEAIKILTVGIQKNPNYPKLAYLRGVLYVNKELYIPALIDFYHYVDNSDLHNDWKKFENDEVMRAIAICRSDLRNQTENEPFPNIENIEKYRSFNIKEYNYTIPLELYGDENYLIDFGKMMGYTVKEVISKQPDYISWCILNLDNFCVSEEIIELIKRKGVDVSGAEKVNLVKLKILEETKPYLRMDDEGKISFDDF